MINSLNNDNNDDKSVDNGEMDINSQNGDDS